MATKKSQRIGIWIIAIALVAGTLGSFLIMILAPKNQAVEQARIEQLTSDYQKLYEAYQDKVNAENARITTELSEQYFEEFHQHVDRIGEFDAASIETLGTEDLKQGEGDEIKADTVYSMYYFGWNPKGVMFDSSFNEDQTALNQPLHHQADEMWEFPGGQTGSVISGWVEGVEGMRIGGIRELTLPADKAYGEQGSGENIPANTPLKFIIMAVPMPDRSAIDAIEEPEMPKELRDHYRRQYGIDL